jgi:membrane protein DedA with SNARE-associated domain
LTLALGLTLSFVFGYVLGRAVPERRLRAWIGAGAWDAVRVSANRRAWWWIALARPLPVLAEMTAVLAGAWRVPPVAAIGTAALSSLAVSILYAAGASLGRDQPDVLSAFAASLALPALAWFVHRRVLARLRRG